MQPSNSSQQEAPEVTVFRPDNAQDITTNAARIGMVVDNPFEWVANGAAEE